MARRGRNQGRRGKRKLSLSSGGDGGDGDAVPHPPAKVKAVPPPPSESTTNLEVPEEATGGMLFRNKNEEFNKDIIETICNNLETADLKNVRLVCRLLQEGSLKAWRRNARIVLRDDEEIPKRQKNGITLKEFKSKLENKGLDDELLLRKHPFQKYKLVNWELDLTSQPWFWNHLGSRKMTSVHFANCIFHAPQPGVFKTLVLEKTCNLKELVLSENLFEGAKDRKGYHGPRRPDYRTFFLELGRAGEFYYNDKDICKPERKLLQPNLKSLDVVGGEFPFSWADLFCHFPGLEILKLGRLQDCHERAWPLFLELQKVKELNLRDIDVTYSHHHLKKKDISQLLKVDMPFLESLAFVLSDEEEEAELRPVFSKFVDTLKVLKLVRPPFHNPPFEDLHFGLEMSCMTELHLYGNVVSNFKFLKWLPNLRSIVISRNCYGMKKCMENQYSRYTATPFDAKDMINQATTTLKGVVLGKMTEFEMDFLFDPKSLGVLSRWMPNLKDLRMIMDNEALSQVYASWPKLEKLSCLYGSNVNDDGIVGSTNANAAVRKGKTDAPSGVTVLQNLKSFKLETLCNSSKLSDRAVRGGFSKLPVLQEIKICVSNEMTDEVLKTLEAPCCNATVYRNNDNGKKLHRHTCCKLAKWNKRRI